MKTKLKHFFLTTALMLIVGCFAYVAIDMYASGTISFGSESYQINKGDVFNIGVYVASDYVASDYHVELNYDSSKIRYLDGADRVDVTNGVMYFDGSSNQTNFRFWLTCEAIESGNTSITIANSTIHTVNDAGELVSVDITSQAKAPLTVVGDEAETVSESEVDAPQDEDEEEVAGAVVEPQEEKEEEATNSDIESDDNSNDAIDTKETVEPAETEVNDNVEPSEVPISQVKESFTIFGISGPQLYIILGILSIGVIFSIIGLILLIVDMKREKKAKNIDEESKQELVTLYLPEDDKDDIEFIDVENEEKKDVEPSVPVSHAVIKVENVSMKFNIATSNASGIKDYIIQKLKKQVTTKEFYALNDINFEVFKGEVVGIIGTNGSGKSTLLKIVSGAMTPTTGRVVVDRRKIQILTLGTGFDMELTARENVYLNGSIIGYTKEFIDSHYDEIVEFAELQDFMEEKVKNFSSGMVSRLGFAIATVGGAAEILILDEVLAVGDEFFRKKSLARIKELIHGGSTVLLVSHSMETILENCTKCVWIEKGQLRKVGDPKDVCGEYKKLKEEE